MKVWKELGDSARLTAQDVRAGELGTQRDHAENIVNTLREPRLVLTSDLRVASASRAFYETFGVSSEATVGQFLYDLGNGEWDIPALRRLIENLLPEQSEFRDFQIEHDFPSLGRRVMVLNGRTLGSETNNTHRVLLVTEDVTERKRIEDDLICSNEDLQQFTYVLAHDLRSPANASLRLLQLLTLRARHKLNEEEARMLADSLESVKRLSALTHDLLTWSDAGNALQRKLVPIGEPLQIAVATCSITSRMLVQPSPSQKCQPSLRTVHSSQWCSKT